MKLRGSRSLLEGFVGQSSDGRGPCHNGVPSKYNVEPDRNGLSREQAFDVLRRASQRTNIKVRDIAERIVFGKMDLESLQLHLDAGIERN